MKITLDLELGLVSEAILTAKNWKSVLTGESLESDGGTRVHATCTRELTACSTLSGSVYLHLNTKIIRNGVKKGITSTKFSFKKISSFSSFLKAVGQHIDSQLSNTVKEA